MSDQESPEVDSPERRPGKSFLIADILMKDTVSEARRKSEEHIYNPYKDSGSVRSLALCVNSYENHGPCGCPTCERIKQTSPSSNYVSEGTTSRVENQMSDLHHLDTCSTNVQDELESNNNSTTISVSKLKKKTRTVFSRAQIFYLEAAFDSKRYLSSAERAELAVTLHLSETQVKVWFQNRRNKWKSQMTGDSKYPSNQEPSHLYPALPLAGRYHMGLAQPPRPHLLGHPMLYF